MPGCSRRLSSPDVLFEALRRLGIAWAVVTSADARLARLRLNAAGISPTALVTVEDVAAGKPAPDGYLLAAQLLAIPPQHCLVVDDEVPAIQSGHAAGMLVATLRGLPGDLPLRDLSHLADKSCRSRAVSDI